MSNFPTGRGPVTVVTAVLAAAAASTFGIAYLIHNPVRSDSAALLVAALILVVPTAIVLAAFARRDRTPGPATAEVPPAKRWLEIDGDDETGYVILGDAEAFSAVGGLCEELARSDSGTTEGSITLSNAPDLRIVRQEMPPAVPAPTQQLGGIGCASIASVACVRAPCCTRPALPGQRGLFGPSRRRSARSVTAPGPPHVLRAEASPEKS